MKKGSIAIAGLLAPLLLWGTEVASSGGRGITPPGITAFHSFSSSEGLNNVSVSALAQDPEGFLWTGTEHGLFRLEGNHFRGFDEQSGLPSSHIKGLSSGIHRGLWVSTRKGVRFWDGHLFQPPSALGLSGQDASPGTALNQGGLIIADSARRLHYLSLDGEPFARLDGLPWGKGLTAGTYQPIGDLLVLALGNELWIRSRNAWTHRDLSLVFAESVRAVVVDPHGHIYLRSKEALGMLEEPEAPLQRIATGQRLSSINNVCLGIDDRGRLWTNTAEGILWIKDGASSFIGEREGLPLGGADQLCVDRQGSVWIGGDGVHKLLGEGLWASYTRHQGLPADVVWSVKRTRDGQIWVGTGGGLAVGTAQGFRVLPATRSNQFLGLEEDEDGNLWAGHTPSRERPTPLSVRPAGSPQLKAVPLPGIPAPGSAMSLCADHHQLWIGSSAKGLFRASREGTRLTRVEPVKIPSWPEDGEINQICKAQGPGIWVGGTHGIAHWNGATWATLGRETGLPEEEVLCVASAPGDEAWISFESALALCRIRREGSRLVMTQCFLPPHPLLQQPLMSLITGPDGALWLGTSGGLLRWDGKHIERAGKAIGFPGEDCCQNALTFDDAGGLWVGLSAGLVHALSPQGRVDPTPPRAVVTAAVRSDGKSILDSEHGTDVPWKARNLTFSYCAFGSKDTEGVSYQIRLEGLEEEWRLTKHSEAHYAGLRPGLYHFEIRTVSASGECASPTSLEFRILAPWWLRPWSWMLGLLGLTLIGVRLYRWRTAVFRQRNALLEALVRERTHALEEASLTDPLTGLRNRRCLDLAIPEDALRSQRHFMELLESGKDPRQEKESIAFLILDLDHFKDINDRWGHPAGDAVLVQLASLLRGATRASDTLIRWGGEEFLVVIKRVRQTQVTAMAQKLLEAVRGHSFQLPNGERIQVTCSLGMVPFPLHPRSPELGSWRVAIEMADQCLYAAKRSGRNRWVGAFIRPEAPLEPFAQLDEWEIPQGLERNLMEAACSEPDFLWPAGP